MLNSSFSKYTDWVAIIGIAMYMTVLMGMSGVVTSGFQIIDAHDEVEINHDIQTKGFPAAVKTELAKRLAVRFLPVYSVIRTTKVYVFGENWQAYIIYNLALGMLILGGFYWFGRLLKYSIPAVLAFLFFTFFGWESWFNQATIFFRIASAELPGMAILALSLVAMVYSVRSSKLWNKWEIVFVMLIILNTLIKESFILLVPALIFWKVWYYSTEKNISIIESAKKHWLMTLLLAGVVVLELGILLLVIGTDKMGYVGVSADKAEAFNVLKVIISFFAKDIAVVITILSMVLGLTVVVSNNQVPDDEVKSIGYLAKRFWPHLLLAAAIILPQVALYNRSGIYERYKLPLMLGITFLLLVFSDIVFRAPRRFFVVKVIFVLPLVLFFYRNSRNTYANAVSYSNSAKAETALLNSIQPAKGDKVMVLGDPVLDYEWSISIWKYLSYGQKMENVYVNAVSIGHDERLFSSKDPAYAANLTKIHREEMEKVYWNDATHSSPKYILLSEPEMFEVYLNKQAWFVTGNYDTLKTADSNLLLVRK